jgi:PAS domain S-box-containing protein
VTTRREKPDGIGASSLSERGHHDGWLAHRHRPLAARASAYRPLRYPARQCGQRAIVFLLGALPTSWRCASHPEPERWALSLGAEGISVPESMWNYRNCGDPPSAGSRAQMANFAGLSRFLREMLAHVWKSRYPGLESESHRGLVTAASELSAAAIATCRDVSEAATNARGSVDFDAQPERRLERVRRLRLPHCLTDLVGLNVSAEDFLAAVLKTAAQPIWVVDPDGVIRFANLAAIKALGYDSAGELLGRDSHETIHYRHPDGTPYPAAACPMLLPRATGETVRNDLDWFFRRDGSMFPVSYVSAPMELREGRGVVVAFTDIEDRLRAERVLREHDAVLAAREGALRRIAALVAGGAATPQVFAAIAREVAQVLGMALVVIWRYEPGRPATVVGAWGDRPHPFHAGTTWPVEERTVATLLPDISRPTRIEDFGAIGGIIPDAIAETGIRSGTGAAIVVDGEFWGTMGAGVAEAEPLPDHIEDRLAEFTELVATAIANTEARKELAASRARVVAATDEERRRVVRDLHDGAQQRLVHTTITLKLARRALQEEEEEERLPALLTEALDHAERATAELRELAHGILPAVLTRGGLRAGVDALASRVPVPVENGVAVGRLAAALESTAYFVVAEALTNIVKHARAGSAEVTARVDDGIFQVTVRDDGVGGARPDGSGLLGLADRLAVLDGRLRVESPADGGTLIAADIPLPTGARSP